MKLKPCPVCGNKAHALDQHDGWVFVRCEGYHCAAYLSWPSCGGVATAWNALPRKVAKKRKARGEAGR